MQDLSSSIRIGNRLPWTYVKDGRTGGDVRINSNPSVLIALYLTSCISISSYSLSSFAYIIRDYLSVPYDYWKEIIMVVGQVGFQWLFMRNSSWTQRYTYMVIALSVSMVGSIMLLPLIFYSFSSAVSPMAASFYFLVVVFSIFLLHRVLVKKKGLPLHLTYTWILYRLFLLLYLFYPRS